ncbi:MAG: YggT family protein [Actinomycetaceae bacterium]|nr:YggT family protein [Arcanobacterium sp.]MDD7505428.1 YggT family protein [Actinomycetaceae bacterium]MDY6142763.1 YggT family protein [Arcanobacterium sp.]
MTTIGIILYWLCELYLLVLFTRVILDLVMIFNPSFTPRGVLLVIANFVYRLTDPPLRMLRFIPPLRLGAVALDIGFLVLYFGVKVIQMIIRSFII